MADWTIQKLLGWMTDFLSEKDVDSPRLSAEMLLSHSLGLKRIELYTNFDKILSQPQLDNLRGLVKRTADKEPISYLTGKKEFYSIELTVGAGCLIPRPETELLVEHAIEFIRSRSGPQSILDLGTGSGCISIAIAKNCKHALVTAVDISESALKFARQNVSDHNLLEQINIIAADLFEQLGKLDPEPKFDLIVSNPPYVSTGEFEQLDRKIRAFEPPEALLAGPEGLDIYRKIISDIRPYLKSDAAVMLEIGSKQTDAVIELLGRTGIFSDIYAVKDFQGLDRLIIAKAAHF